MRTAVVLSAGGMFAAWEAGVWSVLQSRVQPDLFLGASAGAWNAWMLAGGATAEELMEQWLDPAANQVLQFGLHRFGVMRPDGLHRRARELFERFRPRTGFGLTVVEVPRMRPRIIRGEDVTWQHLAATCSIPCCFPPVRIDGRYYVDGGLMGALPLWAAEEMGATKAIAINAWTVAPFRLLHKAIGRKASGRLEVIRIEPSRRLGPVASSLRWSRQNICDWIGLGQEDANCALTSITM